MSGGEDLGYHAALDTPGEGHMWGVFEKRFEFRQVGTIATDEQGDAVMTLCDAAIDIGEESEIFVAGDSAYVAENKVVGEAEGIAQARAGSWAWLEFFRINAAGKETQTLAVEPTLFQQREVFMGRYAHFVHAGEEPACGSFEDAGEGVVFHEVRGLACEIGVIDAGKGNIKEAASEEAEQADGAWSGDDDLIGIEVEDELHGLEDGWDAHVAAFVVRKLEFVDKGKRKKVRGHFWREFLRRAAGHNLQLIAAAVGCPADAAQHRCDAIEIADRIGEPEDTLATVGWQNAEGVEQFFHEGPALAHVAEGSEERHGEEDAGDGGGDIAYEVGDIALTEVTRA